LSDIEPVTVDTTAPTLADQLEAAAWQRHRDLKQSHLDGENHGRNDVLAKVRARRDGIRAAVAIVEDLDIRQDDKGLVVPALEAVQHELQNVLNDFDPPF
jgi:hypothetical protein